MIRSLAIVGDGLIGRSVQLAWRRRHPDAPVIAVDRGDDLGTVAGADVVVLAAPVDVIVALLPALAALPLSARVVTDTGSTKRTIVDAATRAGLACFVPGHPMAGGTAAGPSAARADLFDGRTWFLLSGDATAEARAVARDFVASLGARVVEMTDRGEAHDRLVAAISHLPQVVATVLRARVGETVGVDGLRLAGAGLRDTTRLAASQVDVWAPILEANAPALAPLLSALAADLERAAADLGDRAAMARLFARAHAFPIDP